MESRSQHGEDAYILPLIDPNSARYVVDVGANDGYSWSNSYAFVQEGFGALLVEPMARYAEFCRQHHRGNKSVAVEQAAIMPHEGHVKFYICDDPDYDMLAMTSSVRREIVFTDKVVEVEVPCVPLSTLLERHNVPRDYAVLNVDAEGVDLEVLQTAGLDRWRPSVICVEYGLNDGAIDDFLVKHKYALRDRLGPNGIYVRVG